MIIIGTVNGNEFGCEPDGSSYGFNYGYVKKHNKDKVDKSGKIVKKCGEYDFVKSLYAVNVDQVIKRFVQENIKNDLAVGGDVQVLINAYEKANDLMESLLRKFK